MNKATIALIMIAALGLGWLIGASVADREVEDTGSAISAAAPATASDSSTGGAPLFRYLSPGSVTVQLDDFGSPLPSAIGENFVPREGMFKSETVVIDLALDASVEYKAIMQQGDAIVYNWKTNRGSVYYDFHAHDDAFEEGFFTRYQEGEGGNSAGSIVAPYAGEHGWYFLNIEDGPTTVTLQVAGFYEEIIEIDLGGN